MARLWKLVGCAHPSSFALIPQKMECARRIGELCGMLKALNYVREFMMNNIARQGNVYTDDSVILLQKNFVIMLPNAVVCKNRLVI